MAHFPGLSAPNLNRFHFMPEAQEHILMEGLPRFGLLETVAYQQVAKVVAACHQAGWSARGCTALGFSYSVASPALAPEEMRPHLPPFTVVYRASSAPLQYHVQAVHMTDSPLVLMALGVTSHTLA